MENSLVNLNQISHLYHISSLAKLIISIQALDQGSLSGPGQWAVWRELKTRLLLKVNRGVTPPLFTKILALWLPNNYLS